MNMKWKLLVGASIILSITMPPAQSRWYDQATLNKGSTVFQLNCASCHKANAEGTLNWKTTDNQGKLPPPPLNGTAHAWHHDKETLTYTIREGGVRLGGTMPAFKDKLSGSDIEAAISYFQSKWPEELYQKWENRFLNDTIPSIGSNQNNVQNTLVDKNKITRFLKLRLRSDKVSEPVETPVDGIYLTQFSSKFAYLTENGRYVFMGNLIDLERGQNLTNLARTKTPVPATKVFIPTIKESSEKSEMTDMFKASLGSNNVSEPVKTAIDSIYQVQFGDNFAYLTEDGRYVFMANLVDLERGLNLTSLAKRQVVKIEMAQFSISDKAIFPAIGVEKAVVDIFTDTSCSTCRKLFKEVPELQQAGISVRYLPFPDTGLQGPGYQTLKQVWCAEDKAEALSIGKGLKQGNLPTGECNNAKLVDKGYALGKKVGVVGTPAIFKTNGEQIKGYVPSEKLIPMVLNK